MEKEKKRRGGGFKTGKTHAVWLPAETRVAGKERRKKRKQQEAKTETAKGEGVYLSIYKPAREARDWVVENKRGVHKEKDEKDGWTQRGAKGGSRSRRWTEKERKRKVGRGLVVVVEEEYIYLD